MTLPPHVISGTYYLIPWADSYGNILEDPLEVNINPDDPNEYNSSNYKARAIDIIGLIPPPIIPPSP